MTISVEVEDYQSRDQMEVTIFLDEEGLDILIKKLTWLIGKKDHLHLMTPAWAGDDLSDAKLGGEAFVKINHLRLFKV